MEFETSDSHTVVFSREAIMQCGTIKRMLETQSQSQFQTQTEIELSIKSAPLSLALPFTRRQLRCASRILHYGSYGDLPLQDLYNVIPVLDYMECPVHLRSVASHIGRQLDRTRTRLEMQNTSDIREKMRVALLRIQAPLE